MNHINTLKQALEALDIAQSLLEKSSHHQIVLEAYTNLRELINKVEPVKSFDEVFDVIDWDVWRSQPIRELVRMIHSKTAQLEPLTDSKIADMLENANCLIDLKDYTRAVQDAEAAHGITKGAP